MRFDLEIPSTYVDLTYISEGSKIPSASVPLYYMDIDYRTKIPSDFLTINEDVVEDPTSELVFEEQEGPSFGIRGNNFLVTNMSKYSVTHNARVPLFHKAVLNERVSEFSIKIVDHLGTPIDRSEYVVEESSNITNIYMNKQDKILFAEYISDNKAYKKLINLVPVFTEINWDDIVRNPSEIPKNKYLVSDDGILQTTFSGKLYVKYAHDIKLIQAPVANINDSWYLGIQNTKFQVIDTEDSGITYTYEVPEFYIQNPMSQSRLEEVKEKKCKVLFDDFIKTQSVPSSSALDRSNIYVRDYYTGKLRYAFTTNSALEGVRFEDSYFSMAKDWNNDGVIQLPIKLSVNDVVTATYLTDNNYYKFRFLNLNSVEVGKDHYFSIYMKPNPQVGELGVYFAIIGKVDSGENTGTFRQGRAFKTLEDYNTFISTYNCYHVSTIGISTSAQLGISNLTDVRRTGGHIDNKEAACKITPDVFYKDIIEGKLSLPTNDTLVAAISAETLISKNIIKLDKNTLTLDQYSTKFLDKVAETISSNLDATTQAIVELDASGNRISTTY